MNVVLGGKQSCKPVTVLCLLSVQSCVTSLVNMLVPLLLSLLLGLLSVSSAELELNLGKPHLIAPDIQRLLNFILRLILWKPSSFETHQIRANDHS